MNLGPADWLVVAGLAAVFVAGHFLAPRLASLTGGAEGIVAGVAAGIAVAFIFGNMLPRLAQGGALLHTIGGTEHLPSLLVESGLFLTALIGLLVIYSFQSRNATTGQPATPSYRFRIATFAFVSLTYGLSLPGFVASGWDYATLLTVVMTAHAISRDRILAQGHPEEYTSRDRWIGLGATGLGVAAFALLPPVSPLVLLLPMAFLAGSLLMTTFRNEMPAPSRRDFSWVILGAIVTTGLLVAASFVA